MNVNWYPGHMAKTRRMITENLKLVDAVCEITDARIPGYSRNPDIDSMAGSKPRVIVLNREDQADPGQTALWLAHYRQAGIASIAADSKSGAGVSKFAPAIRHLLSEKLARYQSKGQSGRALRLMVVGIPNVGKSSFINRVAKRAAAKTEDRPGVTRGKQWITIGPGLELLDTPGILWPKIDDPEAGLCLAFTGAVKDDVLDLETLSGKLLENLANFYPKALTSRYKFDIMPGTSGYDLLAMAARARGFLLSGGVADTERMAKTLLDEFRGGKLGRFTLEQLDSAGSGGDEDVN